MLNFKVKEQLKQFLMKRQNMVSTDPHFFTKRFCILMGVSFDEIIQEAIDWQNKYGYEIQNEYSFITTIL